MRTPLVIGNWKMHGTQAMARALASAVAARAVESGGVEHVLCPPFVLLPVTARTLDGSAVRLGAQNVSEYADGAHTGEVSASMLTDLGCRYVLVGHSERRQAGGETSAQVVAKLARAVAAGLTPVLCVGETLAERQAGRTAQAVTLQLAPLCEHVDAASLLGAIAIAYEPVWAIGTGETASPTQAQAVHASIRGMLAGVNGALAARTRLLYGGSVKPENAAELFAMPDIDGGLIGGASLQAEDFCAIVRAAAPQSG
jgi:triosephosphate isomerase